MQVKVKCGGHKFHLETPVRCVKILTMTATKLTARRAVSFVAVIANIPSTSSAHRWHGLFYIEAELTMRFDQHSCLKFANYQRLFLLKTQKSRQDQLYHFMILIIGKSVKKMLTSNMLSFIISFKRN